MVSAARRGGRSTRRLQLPLFLCIQKWLLNQNPADHGQAKCTGDKQDGVDDIEVGYAKKIPVPNLYLDAWIHQFLQRQRYWRVKDIHGVTVLPAGSQPAERNRAHKQR